MFETKSTLKQYQYYNVQNDGILTINFIAIYGNVFGVTKAAPTFKFTLGNNFQNFNTDLASITELGELRFDVKAGNIY